MNIEKRTPSQQNSKAFHAWKGKWKLTMVPKTKVNVKVNNEYRETNSLATELKSFPRLIRKVKINNRSKDKSESESYQWISRNELPRTRTQAFQFAHLGACELAKSDLKACIDLRRASISLSNFANFASIVIWIFAKLVLLFITSSFRDRRMAWSIHKIWFQWNPDFLSPEPSLPVHIPPWGFHTLISSLLATIDPTQKSSRSLLSQIWKEQLTVWKWDMLRSNTAAYTERRCQQTGWFEISNFTQPCSSNIAKIWNFS